MEVPIFSKEMEDNIQICNFPRLPVVRFSRISWALGDNLRSLYSWDPVRGARARILTGGIFGSSSIFSPSRLSAETPMCHSGDRKRGWRGQTLQPRHRRTLLPCPASPRRRLYFAYRKACAQKGTLGPVKVVKWYITNDF